ncbi:MAG: sulfite exporter TauE/SafE family protein [Magnetococcus sp. YQC-9]
MDPDVPELGLISLAITLLSGLTMGMTACTAYCLPYFGSWVLGGVPERPWGAAGWFLLGRVTAYAMLGGVAAALGRVLVGSQMAQTGRLILVVVSLLLGVWLLMPSRDHAASGCSGHMVRAWPAFGLGLAISLVPCPPLTALLAACALSEQITVGLVHGALFGVAASLFSALLVAGVVGRAGGMLRTIHPGMTVWMRRGAGLALIALAARSYA